MTFNPLMGIAVASVREHLVDSPTVVELGNQRFTVTEEAWKEVASIIDPGAPMCVETTDEFYNWLGFEDYYAIDVNTRMGSVAMDLNEDLATKYDFRRTFDLVTNNGTGEHIFDQRAVFQNVHQLCKAGGVMLHVVPFLPWVNHGFYNYNPVLFRDLALANGYEWLFLWIGNRWGTRSTFEPQGWRWSWVFKEKRPIELENLLNKLLGKGDLMVVAALRKADNRPFRVPMQGKYLKDIEPETLKERYGT